MVLSLVVLSLGSALAPAATPMDAARARALQNALRGLDLVKAGAALKTAPVRIAESRVPPKRCAIRLLEVPADRGIDPKMILRVPREVEYDRMPKYEGLAPCPRERTPFR